MTVREDNFTIIWEACRPRAEPGTRNYLHAVWREKKGDAKKAWTTLTKGMDELGIIDLTSRIELSIESQSKHRRLESKANHRMCRPPGLGPWLRQHRWEDEFDVSKSDLMEQGNHSVICSESGCKLPSDCQGLCAWHYTRTNNPAHFGRLYQELKDIGLEKLSGETGADYAARCRAWIKANAKRAINGMMA